MALASAAVPIATVDAWQQLSINRRQIASLQIRFYSDADGTVAIEASAGGTATINIRTTEPVYDASNSYRDTLTSNIESGSRALSAGATWYAAGFGSGVQHLEMSANTIVAPPGAASYRFLVNEAVAP
jgi:hypothetical protein